MMANTTVAFDGSPLSGIAEVWLGASGVTLSGTADVSALPAFTVAGTVSPTNFGMLPGALSGQLQAQFPSESAFSLVAGGALAGDQVTYTLYQEMSSSRFVLNQTLVSPWCD